jgi:hypothetical protein
MEREDEEGPDEGRWRCLNAFWAVGRRVAIFGGGGALLRPELEDREEDEEDGRRRSSSGRIKCLRLHRAARGVMTGVGGCGSSERLVSWPPKAAPKPPESSSSLTVSLCIEVI